MYHSKERSFILKMMLIFPSCIVLLISYGILYIAHSIPLAYFNVKELLSFLNLNLSCPGGGGGGYSNFFRIRRLGPSIYRSPNVP